MSCVHLQILHVKHKLHQRRYIDKRYLCRLHTGEFLFFYIPIY